ncbi:polysaccharide lyase family 7 protein [Psychromonas sp.]|nr:polysaccharide lyase family 7 protein [Psychromonas sp.]
MLVINRNNVKNKTTIGLLIVIALTGCASSEQSNDNPSKQSSLSVIPTINSAGMAPSEKYDLSDWKLEIATDENGDGKSDSIQPNRLNNGYQNTNFFYLGEDGGLVFTAPMYGTTTSSRTKYVRTELREMLRGNDTSIPTAKPGKNNWVFSSFSESDQNIAGGVDGTLDVTLKVDRVSSTGKDYQQGRIIIGQIHAKKDEPVRIYYRKLKGNKNGSIYLGHEINGTKQTEWIDMIGTKSNTAENPEDGIALGEMFSYQIKVIGHQLSVTIIREGKPDVVNTIDMKDSGYHDKKGEYMFFKVGIYHVVNTGDADDYAQATFYKIDNKHNGYAN